MNSSLAIVLFISLIGQIFGANIFYLVSQDKPTRQSSTLNFGRSSRAVDGDWKFKRLGYSCSTTKYEKRPWWGVDLLQEYYISKIRIISNSIFGANTRNIVILAGKTKKSMRACNIYRGHIGGKWVAIGCKAQGVRYVAVALRQPGHLALCEVKIYGRPSNKLDDILLSEKKPARQSSTTYRGYASRAVDGKAYGIYKGKTCTRTKKERNPWWSVDLKRNYQIDAVVIYNRQYFGKRLRNFDVLVKVGNSKKSKWRLCARRRHYVANGAAITLPCLKIARHVMIRKRGRGILSLCEVRVYGYRLDDFQDSFNFVGKSREYVASL